MLALLAAVPDVIWWGVGALGIGAGIKEAGQGANTGSNALLKVALGAAAIYYVVKK